MTTMANEPMDALQLMAAADVLTGVKPTMAPGDIRARLISSTPERQKMIYLCNLLKQTRDSAERAEIRGRIDVLVAENGHLKSVIKQLLSRGGFVYTPELCPGRPKKSESEAKKKRDWARAYRARKRAQPLPPTDA